MATPAPGTVAAANATAARARAVQRVAQLGDSRTGKLAANLTAFGRALRRAGVHVDSARIALAQQAVETVGVRNKADMSAALEAVLVSCEQDRAVFRELFGVFFRDPKLAQKMLQQMLPKAEGQAEAPKERPRVREALMPPKGSQPKPQEKEIDLDAAMTASEYHLVEHLVRAIPLPLPTVAARRTQAGDRGARVHWAHTLQSAARHGGDVMALWRLRRRRQPLPLLLLVDVSGSMERYARLLLAFLHASTQAARVRGRRLNLRRDVFAFGTDLTDLTGAFPLADTDDMLVRAGALIRDFAGGTRLGDALATLRQQDARRLIGGRTLVLIASDGLDTGEPGVLERELQWLKRHTRRILWLNPLLRFNGYAPLARGAAVLHRAADGMLAVHDITHLQELAAAISALLKK